MARIMYRIPHCTFSKNFRKGVGSFSSISSAITPANLRKNKVTISFILNIITNIISKIIILALNSDSFVLFCFV